MHHRIKRAIQFIEINYQSKLSVKELAKYVNLSESRFQHLFKIEMSVPPARYLKRLRIVKAAELLRSDEPLSIGQIMMRVGIRDKSNFARDFKEVFGVSPTVYRARAAKEPVSRSD